MLAAFVGGYIGMATYHELVPDDYTIVIMSSLPAAVAGILMIVAITLLYNEKQVPSRLYWMAVILVALATLAFSSMCLIVSLG